MHAIETEWEVLQTSGENSNAMYGRKVGYNEATIKKRIVVKEMTILRWMCGVIRKDKTRKEHIRGTTRVRKGFQKDHGETIELVRACDEER